MTSGWPPERPGRRRPDAPPGGSRRRSALRTPPHGIDLGDDGNADPDEGWLDYLHGRSSSYGNSGQSGFAGGGKPRYPGSEQPSNSEPKASGRSARRGRRGGPGQQDQESAPRGGPGQSDPGYGPPGAEPSYYNLAYGAHGYDTPGRGPGDGSGPGHDWPGRDTGNDAGPVYGAPVADVQAPGRRGRRGTPDSSPGSGNSGNVNAGSPRSRHGRPAQGGQNYPEPGAAQAPHPGPGPGGSRTAGPAEPRYPGPGPADPRYAGPGYRGPGRAGPQSEPQGYGSPRPAGPGPGRGSGSQVPPPRSTQPGHRRRPRPDGDADTSPPRRDGGEDAYRPRRARPDSAGHDAPPLRRDGGEDAHRSRRARLDSTDDGALPPRRASGDDPHRRRSARPDDSSDAFRLRPDGGGSGHRPRRARPDADIDDAPTSRWDAIADAPPGRDGRRDVGGDDAYPGRRGGDDASRPRPDADDAAYRVPAQRGAGVASAPFLAPGPSRVGHPEHDADDLAGSADTAGPATAWIPAAADTAIATRTDRPRTADPDRGSRPGSRRGQSTGKKAPGKKASGQQSRLGASTQVLPRVDRKPAPDEEPARRRGDKPGRRTGLRLTRKTWLLGGAGVLAVAVIAAVALVMLGPSGPSGPKHSLTTPLRLGAFTRSAKLTKQMDVSAIERRIIAQSSGQASHLVSSVYEAGSPVAGSGTPAQVMLFIGGQLTGASPTSSVKSFLGHFSGAARTGAGSMAGDAACVAAQAKLTGGQTVCAWFDNNTFGELVSPNMPVGALSSELRSIRPDVEHVVK